MAFYTTPTEVRQESGFGDNANITDVQIASIIDLVENEIDSRISKVYSLPMPIFYKNTIIFSGVGDGSGTMTITIDGQDYVISITDGITASEVADLFRVEILANTDKDFLLEDMLGHGEVVSMVSNNQSETPTDVSITSTDPQTVSGITATGGTTTGYPIPLITSIARGMAGAKLLIQEYGEEAQDTTKDGFARMKIYQSLLDEIAVKKLALIDFNGDELTRSSGDRISFYPTEASRNNANNPTENKFTMNDKY